MRYVVTLVLFSLLLVGNAAAQSKTLASNNQQINFQQTIEKAKLPETPKTLTEASASSALQANSTVLQTIGYGYIDKNNSATGSISTLLFNDMAVSGYSNLAEYMQGRVPGVLVTRDPSSSYGYRILIRGVNSLMLSNEPLVVVNGVAMSSSSAMGDISPYNVKSIDVLKGPAAAIYGSRGANGVIIINTK